MAETGRTPKRRWHSLAILASGLTYLLLAAANLVAAPVYGPGIMDDGKYGPHFGCGWTHLKQGWPFSFLEREIEYPSQMFLTVPADWQSGAVRKFWPTLLLANLGVLVCGTWVVGWTANRYVHELGWRFRLAHLLAAVFFFALLSAYIGHRWRLHRQQEQFVRTRPDLELDAEWAPFGPYWLRRFTGDRAWSWGDTIISVGVNDDAAVMQVPHKETVRVLRVYNTDSLSSLQEFPNVEGLDSMWNTSDLPACVRAMAQRRSLRGINLCDLGASDKELIELATLPRLEHLDVTGSSEITDAGVAQLEQTKSLRRVNLIGTGVTKDGVERLRRALPSCKVVWNDEFE